MTTGLLGKKIGMTQIYDDAGSVVPVTVLQAGPCVVLQVKSTETDGYDALQLGFEDQKPQRESKAFVGHCQKAQTTAKRFVREIRADKSPDAERGQQMTVEVFGEIAKVDVTGVSKGKGFAGGMKRHGFHGASRTHGQMGNRVPGAIGTSATPARTIKGMRMAGHMGAVRRTVRNLEVVRIDPENNLLLVKGAVPGPRNGYVIIRESL